MPSFATVLARLSRLGWVDTISPVERCELDGLTFYLKRDDKLEALGGGNKPRKLDVLLAEDPFRSAAGWHSTGAIGSGHLAALVLAGEKLGKPVHAHLFWEPVSGNVRENLALTVSKAARVSYYGSRLALAVRAPRLLLGGSVGGWPVIPPGGLTVRGTLGMVRAGFELGQQIRARGEGPDSVYVALGSGGSAVGIAMGLGLAGVRVPVRAVASVERWLATRGRIERHRLAVLDELVRLGVDVADLEGARDAVLGIERRFVGPGYGIATEEGRAACRFMTRAGVTLEPIYTGKAAAAMLAEARAKVVERPLLWVTVHAPGFEAAADWQDKLPAALAARLAQSRGPNRRRLLIAGATAVGLGALGLRLGAGYPSLEGFVGEVLSEREANILLAVAEAVLVNGRGESPAREALLEIPARIDRYLATMPRRLRLEVRGAIALVEQGTWAGGYASRLSGLPPAERRDALAELAATHTLAGQAVRGVRDLVLLGYYQQPGSWPALGYEGPRLPPRVAGVLPMAWPLYDDLRAGPGVFPEDVGPATPSPEVPR